MAAESWVCRSGRDEQLMLTGAYIGNCWTYDPRAAAHFPTYRDAERFRDEWCRKVHSHFPVNVKRFRAC